jgi:glycosyltransferase involved in cell wall biosynthesis
MSPSLIPLFSAESVGSKIVEISGVDLEAELKATERHVFTPHSLAVLKEENYRTSPLKIRRNLKFCERRNHEFAVCKSARAFAATSTEIAERMRTHMDVPSEKMFYFPAGIDRNLFRNYSDDEIKPLYEFLSSKTGCSIEQLTRSAIVFETSRMDRTKRKDIILSSFALAAQDIADALCMIGGGPENQIFQQLVEQKNSDSILEERSFLLGFIPDEIMYLLFSRADIFITSSEMEGFGLSAAQAAAIGTPLISSDLVPFALQYVPDSALIVRAGDIEGFADAIGQLLRNPTEREKRGRKLAEQTSMLDWIEQTKAFLEHLRKSGLAVADPTCIKDKSPVY